MYSVKYACVISGLVPNNDGIHEPGVCFRTGTPYFQLIPSLLSLSRPFTLWTFMTLLRAANLIQTSRRTCLSKYSKVTFAVNSFNSPRRNASFYNTDIAGLTEDEAEVLKCSFYHLMP